MYTRSAVFINLSTSLEIALTPEFLQENGVVPDDWSAESSPERADDIQEVRYDSGLVVRVSPNGIGFNLSVEPVTDLTPHLILGNGIVERFLEQQSSPDVRSFTIQLFGLTMMPEGSPGIKNIGLPLDDVAPIITFRGLYNLEDRVVRFYIRETTRDPSDFINCLEFSCETTYSSDDPPSLSSVDLWQAITTHWKTWVDNCNGLVSDFYSEHITDEHITE